MLFKFTGLGRSVLGKTVPSVSSTMSRVLRLSSTVSRVLCPQYSRPQAQFFPIRTSRPVNNIYIQKKHLYRRKVITQINFNPGLPFAGFQTILPNFQQFNMTWARDPIENQYLVSGQLQKHVTSMSCTLEPAIWSRNTGQQIPCFDRCH